MNGCKTYRLGSCLALFMLVVTLVGPGCQSFHSNFPKEHSVPQLAMFLQPGDSVELTFLGNTDLNASQMIRRDGKISLQLVGEVQAAGKTPGELEEELRQLYAKQLQIKEIMVMVKSPAQVFVSGSVEKPGLVQMDRPMTAFDAIVKSGGFKIPNAEVRNVVVVRHEGSKRFAYAVNLKPILNGESDNPFYLRPFDVVFVPRTRITKIDDWVDQHINRMIPRPPFGFTSEGEVFFR